MEWKINSQKDKETRVCLFWFCFVCIWFPRYFSYPPSVVRKHFSCSFCICMYLFCTWSNQVPNTSLLIALPLLRPYRLVDIILKIIMRVMWFAGGFHWMTIKGRRALPTEAPILTLAPHSSYFDAIPVTMTMASIVMKAESKDIPLWGSKWQRKSCFFTPYGFIMSVSGCFSKTTCFDVALPVQSCWLALAWLACLGCWGVTGTLSKHVILKMPFFVCGKWTIGLNIYFVTVEQSGWRWSVEKQSGTFSGFLKTLFGSNREWRFIPATPFPMFPLLRQGQWRKTLPVYSVCWCQLHPRSRSLLSSPKNIHHSFSAFFFWPGAVSAVCHFNWTGDTRLTVTHSNVSVQSILKIQF